MLLLLCFLLHFKYERSGGKESEINGKKSKRVKE